MFWLLGTWLRRILGGCSAVLVMEIIGHWAGKLWPTQSVSNRGRVSDCIGRGGATNSRYTTKRPYVPTILAATFRTMLSQDSYLTCGISLTDFTTEFLEEPSNRTVAGGSLVITLTCTPPTSYPPAEVTWLKWVLLQILTLPRRIVQIFFFQEEFVE